MTGKSPTALRTIGEVAEDLGVATHVLRFWESKFSQIKPQKRRGRRYYRVEDIALIKQIKDLLYTQGYTIRGVQQYLLEETKNKKKIKQQPQEESTKVEQIKAEQELEANNENVDKDLFGNEIAAQKKPQKTSDDNKDKFSQQDLFDIQQIQEGLRDARKRLQDVA